MNEDQDISGKLTGTDIARAQVIRAELSPNSEDAVIQASLRLALTERELKECNGSNA